MKLQYIIAATLLLTHPLRAATEAEREFDRLTQERDKALASAAEPINRRYQSALDALLKKATQANDLETALKIKQTIERLAAQLPDSGSRANAELLGAWRVQNLADGAKGTYDINTDNTFKMNGRRTGTWEVKKNQLTLRYDRGGFERYDLPTHSGQLKGTNDRNQSLTLTRESQ